MIYFDIEEEYGYRQWIWAYPGTPEEAMADWKARRRPMGLSDEAHKTKGTLHEVRVEYVWHSQLDRPLNQKKFHCQGAERDAFCDDCAEVAVYEVLRSETRLFPAITSLKQFAGRGHVHMRDDTYLMLNDGTIFSDLHIDCSDGCQVCKDCNGHTLTPVACRVCRKPRCADCIEDQFVCTSHSAVDALASIATEEKPQ